MTQNEGRLELEIVDVNRVRLTEPVDIELRHQVLQDTRRVNNLDASKIIAITGLRTEPQGLYTMRIEAPSYRPVARFVTIPASGLQREQVVLPIRPERAEPVFPSYDELDDRVKGLLERSARVEGHVGVTGRALYDAMDKKPKAGLLNIAKKSLGTAFRDGKDLLPHVTLVNAFGDRCFVEIPRALIAQMPSLVDGDIFRSVNGSLHHPPAGMTPAGSFKTLDLFGNLQLTLFESADSCRADVDIDDAAGIGHVFQVARNSITKEPTHPYNIHQILVMHQHLDPGYRLVPKKD